MRDARFLKDWNGDNEVELLRQESLLMPAAIETVKAIFFDQEQ